MRLEKTLAPLRHRPSRRQFLAGAISTTGSSLAPVAIAFGVLAATGSARTLGLVLLAYSIPMLVLMIDPGDVAGQRQQRVGLLQRSGRGGGGGRAEVGRRLERGRRPGDHLQREHGPQRMVVGQQQRSEHALGDEPDQVRAHHQPVPIPEEALSRVSAFDFLGSFALRPLGYTLAAALVAIGAQSALLALAVLVVAATFLSLLAPGVRNLQRRAPEPDVDESIVDAVPA